MTKSMATRDLVVHIGQQMKTVSSQLGKEKWTHLDCRQSLHWVARDLHRPLRSPSTETQRLLKAWWAATFVISKGKDRGNHGGEGQQ